MKSLFLNFVGFVFTVGVLTTATTKVGGQPVAQRLKFDTETQTIQGLSGGPIDSKGCGFISSSPNHVIKVSQRIDYMRLKVQAVGGQPTLLVIGPKPGDSFCVLGDQLSGFKPEISGVWEPGQYKIYVGDRNGANYQFTLNISRK
jgi:hypothetical protein